jgi:hypothetical protein
MNLSPPAELCARAEDESLDADAVVEAAVKANSMDIATGMACSSGGAVRKHSRQARPPYGVFDCLSAIM